MNLERFAGLVLNIEKTKAILLGLDKYSDITEGNISYCSSVKCLGVHVGHDAMVYY